MLAIRWHDRIPPSGSNLTGEQAVFAVTGTPEDVILYRGAGGVVPHGWPGDQTCANASLCVLTASSRNTSDPESAWTSPTPTTIPDLGSNLNVRQVAAGFFFILAALSWVGVGIRKRRALPSPLSALKMGRYRA